jgi:hypothetical protein
MLNVRSRTADRATQEHSPPNAIASCVGEQTMTVRASQVLSSANDNFAVERVRPPAPVWFAGTLVVMNVASAVMSLMA